MRCSGALKWVGSGAQAGWAQVAEWLMAADCKSAGLWTYGGSNPPLCTMNCGVGMREEPQRVERKGLKSTGSDLDRKFWMALALYAVLAALAWFTLGEGAVLVPWLDLSDGKFIAVNKPVQMRLLPLIVLGGFALKTVLARQAEKIRRGGNEGSDTTPKSL